MEPTHAGIGVYNLYPHNVVRGRAHGELEYVSSHSV